MLRVRVVTSGWCQILTMPEHGTPLCRCGRHCRPSLIALSTTMQVFADLPGNSLFINLLLSRSAQGSQPSAQTR